MAALDSREAALERLVDVLRTDAIDAALIRRATHGDEIEYWSPAGLASSLLLNLKESPNSAKQKSSRSLDAQQKEVHPIQEVVDYVALLGSERHLLAHLSRFPPPHPKEVARAYEVMQLKVFKYRDFFGNPPPAIRPGDGLNCFRLAQKIRDEHGSPRGASESQCFESFEGIIDLERQIEDSNPVEFVLQCLAIHVPEIRWHGYGICQSALTFPHLQAFLAALVQIFGINVMNPGGDLWRAYERRFEELASEQSPTWRDIEQYLRSSDKTPQWRQLISGANIPDDELDGAFNCVLNSLTNQCWYERAYESGYGHGLTHGEEACPILRRFLSRGASLTFRNPEDERSTLEELVELIETQWSYPLLPKLSDYICCPLTDVCVGYRRRVLHDTHRPARLSCLAARTIPSAAKDSELPSKVRSQIEVHLILQDLIRAREEEMER